MLLAAGPALGAGPAGAVAGDPHRPARGVWPLDPRPAVVHGFDPPATRYGRGHRGVDLAGHPGQVVRTALAGRVSFAGRIAGRGVVVVDHGGTRTTYEPVLASVHVGDQLATGAPLGRLQLAGSHCLPAWCLHWGLIEGHDHYLDPLALVGALPVVLLPQGRVGPAVAAETYAWARPGGGMAGFRAQVAPSACTPPWACRSATPAVWP